MKIIKYFARLAQLKAHDPEAYEQMVRHVFWLGVVAGSCGTLWLIFVSWIINL